MIASLQAMKSSALKPRLEHGQSIKIIGLGGVGGIVARYGCVFLSSLGVDTRVVFIDGDKFETANATRMLFSTSGNKAEVLRADLLKHFVDSRLAISAIDQFITPENIGQLIREGDIVILTVDNHATRKLVSDFCARGGDADGAAGGDAKGLANVCLISGGNDGVGADSKGKIRRGTYGNCQVFVRKDGRDLTASLTKRHREIEFPADKLPTALDCIEAIASTPQVLFANMMAASTILNSLWLYLCDALHYEELAFDISEGLMRPVA
jgi:hypothetical protein